MHNWMVMSIYYDDKSLWLYTIIIDNKDDIDQKWLCNLTLNILMFVINMLHFK